MSHKWGEPGTDEVPQEVIPQAIWHCAVLEVEACTIAALIGGELKIYTVQWDPELFELLYGHAEKFWHDHIVPCIPPPAGASDVKLLAELYPSARQGRMVEPTALLAEWVSQKTQAAGTIKDAKANEDEAKAKIKEILGDAEGCKGDDWSVSWRNNKDKVSIDYRAIVEHLSPPEDLIAQYTRVKPGPRVLRVTDRRQQ